MTDATSRASVEPVGEWRTPRPVELATPGLTALVLLLSFLLVLFATERRTRPGTSALERQVRYYGVYQKEMLVGWASVGKPRREQTVEGEFCTVESRGSFSLLSRPGGTKTYLTESLYPSDSPNAIALTGSISNSTTRYWECRLITPDITLAEGPVARRLTSERLIVPNTPTPFLLHRYAIGDWERLLGRCDRTDQGFRAANVELFDIEKNTLYQIRCLELEVTFETILGRKTAHTVVAFGSLAQAYFDPATSSLDKLVLLEEQITFVRQDAQHLEDELPPEQRF